MNRRGFLAGVAGFLAAPAIVRASSLMPVSVVPEPLFTSHIGTWEGIRFVEYIDDTRLAYVMYGGKVSFGDKVYDVGGPPPEAAFAS